MTPSRSLQSAAIALALSLTLATLGSLNLLATEQHAATALARAAAAQQTVAALGTEKR